MARKSDNRPAGIDAVRHKDKRKNIATKKLRVLIARDEAKPRTMLLPRDPSPGQQRCARTTSFT